MSSRILELTDVTHAFVQGAEKLEVLNNASLTINSGEIVALVSPSGSGKSTLLQIAGLLETPQSGNVSILGRLINKLDDSSRTHLRLTSLGFIYQYHNLLAEFSARENIMIPQMILGRGKRESIERADILLDKLGLSDRAAHRPGRLSGGEQQRVAIARSFANEPQLILADEPTGNLDNTNAQYVFSLLLNTVKYSQVAALVATHNQDLAKRMDRIIYIDKGKLVES